ncbi:MAG: hypothetical protein GX682_05755 [Clostridiaceae bacterium]|nr:hypothetical protein [Clostridiaceae bacterium]
MDKFKRTLEQSKKFLIVIGVLWIILAIVLVSPIAYCIADATNSLGKFDINIFVEELIPAIRSFSTFFQMFSAKYIGTFGTCLMNYTIVFFVCSIIGFTKTKPKGEYHDVEHGSSDWSENGEQYKVLNKNKGIILAEDNYLPIDKRGNINTLIVGRFWFW